MNKFDDSPEYYRLREAQERERAEKALTDEARAVHLALAERYGETAIEAEQRAVD